MTYEKTTTAGAGAPGGDEEKRTTTTDSIVRPPKPQGPTNRFVPAGRLPLLHTDPDEQDRAFLVDLQDAVTRNVARGCESASAMFASQQARLLRRRARKRGTDGPIGTRRSPRD